MLTLQDGRYHCTELLGEGSMGRTFLADDTRSGQKVAVKALYPSRLATLKDFELFEREAHVLQRLDHPQVPAYIDAFSEGHGDALCYYIVQAYAPGHNLREFLDRGERFDQERLLDLMIQLAEILAYLHSQEPGVVHRDLKPANIILCHQGKIPTLVDFGAVREVVRLTMGGGSTIIGTFGYMPPEQLMGRALPATDLYALGITSLECLTRRTPSDLHGEDAAAMIDALNDISLDLRRVLRRLCAPKVEDRYPSATSLLQDLKQLRSAQTLIHIDRLERDIARRQLEREKALVNATGTAVTFLAGLIAFVILGASFLGLILTLRSLLNSVAVPTSATLALSILGLLVPLLILSTRYIQSSWNAPPPGWLRTPGVISGFDTLSLAESEQLLVNLSYSFEHRGQTLDYQAHAATAPFSLFTQSSSLPDKLQRLNQHKGTSFDIFVDPTNPHNHIAIEVLNAEMEYLEPIHHFDPEHPHHPA
ncbi:hypothetical protein DL240_16785 [Lujinxingia litoralis]|uniref:non-specific serine/threonine protein kinase n=1 Tax=Lujinxingia litoralis TaxID=2211119 RepID=A0A328C634_9DELT|nr:serine/threonine-protein kinase [Lujinxingia litoralis]RAL20460.1 hypothetical protein DL240_16785 [Lujinxingia litoralis]